MNEQTISPKFGQEIFDIACLKFDRNYHLGESIYFIYYANEQPL